jgi:hypothetical protein
VCNLLELANDQFDAGSIIAKAPEVERLPSQIGEQDLVVVAAQLKQRQLPVFCTKKADFQGG